MPTYEYLCTECATPLEVVAAFSDPPLTQCPACGGRLRKVFGNVGVVFKGSGFYRTDSRGKPSGAAAAAATTTPSGKSNGSSSGDSSSTTSTTTGGSSTATKPAQAAESSAPA